METIRPAIPTQVGPSAGAGYFVGVMSGTSMDGVDAALVRFEPAPALVAAHTLALSPALKEELLSLRVPGENEIDRLGCADAALGQIFAQAVRELLAKANVDPGQVGAIGSHGQTIRHRPGLVPPFTLQIGDPNVIATETGIPVVADFRRKDLALGGQGAPLVPAFHDAVFRCRGQDRVIVNLGGIANLTVLPGDLAAPVLGFDTGPGNTLLDGWSRRVLQQPMDRNGALAARGRVVPALLQSLLTHPYFKKPAPKSTGPEEFTMAWLESHLAGGAGAGLAARHADVQATLVELTVQTVSDAIKELPGFSCPGVFACGGGAHNPVLMWALRRRLPGFVVERTDFLGVDASWVEAFAFAWLARQRVLGLPGNLPAATGARRAAVLGGLYSPQ